MQLLLLADIEGNMIFTRDEFAVALHLIRQVEQGHSLPTSIPVTLVPPRLRGLSSRATSTPGTPPVPPSPPRAGFDDDFGAFGDPPAPSEMDQSWQASFSIPETQSPNSSWTASFDSKPASAMAPPPTVAPPPAPRRRRSLEKRPQNLSLDPGKLFEAAQELEKLEKLQSDTARCKGELAKIKVDIAAAEQRRRALVETLAANAVAAADTVLKELSELRAKRAQVMQAVQDLTSERNATRRQELAASQELAQLQQELADLTKAEEQSNLLSVPKPVSPLESGPSTQPGTGRNSPTVSLVKAVYAFAGRQADELSFEQDDVIGMLKLVSKMVLTLASC